MAMHIAIRHVQGTNRFFMSGLFGKACCKNQIQYSHKGSFIDEDGVDRNVYTLYDLDPEQAILIKFQFQDIKILNDGS